MRLGNVDVSKDVLVVAEIGNNHEGSYTLAEELVGLAAEAGVDAVKFQTFRTEHYVSRSDVARFARLKSFELSYSEFERLAGHARQAGVLFLSTPLDLESARFLAAIVAAYKISSSDNTFYPLLAEVAQGGRPILLSTGLAGLEDVARSVDFLRAAMPEGREQDVAVLHCVTAYPVPSEDANLRAITALRNSLGLIVGYSDHTLGIDAAVLAVALGARIIEKHFTIDKKYSDFRDHQLSAEPAEMRELVRRVREAVQLLGSETKAPRPSEIPNTSLVRRSVVARHDLRAGRIIQLEDLTWTRPAGGLPPGREAQLLGGTLVRKVAQGEWIRPADVTDVPSG